MLAFQNSNWNDKLVRRQCLRCCEPLSSATVGFALNVCVSGCSRLTTQLLPIPTDMLNLPTFSMGSGICWDANMVADDDGV